MIPPPLEGLTMSKKKVEKVEPVEEVVFINPAIYEKPVKPEPKEKLLKVMAEQQFVDGNLASFFAQYGYPVEWPRNETRELPKWLIDRCIQSGADLVDGR